MILTLCGAAILFIIQCGRNPGSGTETGNGVVSAMLYNPNGSPAKNAEVVFYPVNYNPRTGGLGKTAVTIDSTTTDTNGNFTITLPVDIYTMQASGDSGLAFQDSVTAVKDSTVRPDPDTLKPAGTIRGVVRLEEDGDPRTIFILFMGTRTFTWPDDAAGNFTSGPMAAGHYRVRLITTTPDYLPLDDTLTVIAGQDDTLADTIVLKYTGIPTPKNVRIVYDTMRQVVNLTWDSASASLVSYYNIYRRNVTADSTPVKINASPVRTNSYRDSTGTQDIMYEYRVAAVNASASEGTKSAAVSVVIASYFVLDSTFGTIGSGQGQFNYPWDIAIAANGDIYIADEENKRVQVFDQFMQYKREFGNGTLMPVNVALDSLGNAYVSGASATGIDNYSIFIFDPTGTIIDTIIIGKFVRDLDLGVNEFYVVTDVVTDSASAFSYDGTLKRTWYIGNDAWSITVERPNRIWISSYSFENKVRVFDTLGNMVDSLNIEPRPFSIAINKTNGRAYINCINDAGDWLKVLDGSHRLLAIYKLPLQAGEPAYIALHPDGSVYEVLQSSGKILKLRSLLP